MIESYRDATFFKAAFGLALMERWDPDPAENVSKKKRGTKTGK
jgi:hypothetical protein